MRVRSWLHGARLQRAHVPRRRRPAHRGRRRGADGVVHVRGWVRRHRVAHLPRAHDGADPAQRGDERRGRGGRRWCGHGRQRAGQAAGAARHRRRHGERRRRRQPQRAAVPGHGGQHGVDHVHAPARQRAAAGADERPDRDQRHAGGGGRDDADGHQGGDRVLRARLLRPRHGHLRVLRRLLLVGRQGHERRRRHRRLLLRVVAADGVPGRRGVLRARHLLRRQRLHLRLLGRVHGRGLRGALVPVRSGVVR
mmetsp:Transcript_26934/g.93489  ORF Transcript_26934/g.93489 Transcript_26934/m.93489 type:complete len:252 (-) Transcript_26934:1301-2056(-)